VFNKKSLTGSESQEIIDARKDKIKTSQAVNQRDLKPNAPVEEVFLKRLDNSNGKQILQAVNRKTRRSLSPSEAADVARIVRQQDDKLGAGVLEAQRNKLSPDARKALQQINSSQNTKVREDIQRKDNILRTQRDASRRG
jgi:hypothetical protein